MKPLEIARCVLTVDLAVDGICNENGVLWTQLPRSCSQRFASGRVDLPRTVPSARHGGVGRVTADQHSTSHTLLGSNYLLISTPHVL
eukprot:m.110410 g.110410  ORF g.110410 m.110410 type:complete len:87 (-) comp16979_c0_seq13:2795-3055(-)